MKRFFKIVLRIVIYVLAFILPIVALAAIGFRSTVGLASKPAHWAVIPEADGAALLTKSFDPTKPTVAIVLGSDQTEITDFLIPYEFFSASEAYNVYAVAPERKLTTLSGGLEVMPDFSYVELDTLLGKSPDVVLIPAFPKVTNPNNQPVLAWIKQQSEKGSFIFSICVGAEVFAATGLLDGRTATTHWGDIARNSTLIGWTLSAFSLSAAVGGIAGGMISNRLGAKRLIFGSLLLALLPLYSIFFLAPGSPSYFIAVMLAGALVNAGMPMLIVSAQDLSPKSAATASGMLMGFSAGIAGLAYVGIGQLQELIGLAPAMGVSYLALIAAAALATKTIKSYKVENQMPVDNITCLCSPCIDQNIAAYPQRQSTIVH